VDLHFHLLVSVVEGAGVVLFTIVDDVDVVFELSVRFELVVDFVVGSAEGCGGAVMGEFEGAVCSDFFSSGF
jgi:hypothetical protein